MKIKMPYPKPEFFVDECEKQITDKKVGEFFGGPVKIATWNCSSGFTTQFEHFRDFMKNRAEPYIDILCLQGIPMTLSGKKHANVHKLFEECGFTYVYDETGPDNILRTMTLFKKLFLERYEVLPRDGNTREDLEFYHIKRKGIEPGSRDGNFMLCNAYFRHETLDNLESYRDKYFTDIKTYNVSIGNPFKVIVGDLNYNAHDDLKMHEFLNVENMTPVGIPTCGIYHADHILSDIYVSTMVDQRFGWDSDQGYIVIERTHFHQPVYGFFMPYEDY